MKLTKKPLHTSAISKSSNSLKHHHESGQSQLSNGSNDECMGEDNRLTLEFKQEASSKYEKTQKADMSDIIGGALNESNTSDLNSNGETNVKQEELAKPGIALHDSTLESRRSNVRSREQSVKLGQVQPDIDDPNFHCRLCDYTLASKSGYRSHLKKCHKMNLMPLVPVINPAILPDWNDPYHYCKSCNYTYASNNVFKTHCRNVHKMKTPVRSAGIPDVHDPNNYCKICNYTYKHKRSYIGHCLAVHKIRRRQLFANPEATPDLQDPNSYCIKCDKTFCNRYTLKYHLYRIHHLTPSSPNEGEPDINDPNGHCHPCGKTFKSKYNYGIHLVSIHSIGKVPHKANNADPDVNDLNNYCRICLRSYSSRASYRTHLQGVHRMVLHPERNLNNLPDLCDPNFYCRVCNKTKKTLNSYREHCIRVHCMVSSRGSISNPSATIDTTHPANYCAQCEYRYSSKYAFVSHLQGVHGINAIE